MIMSSSTSSSVPQPCPHVLSVLLSSLLQGEKDATRVWLRAEMDRRVDPMLHSIFNRLTNKLVNADFGRSRLVGEFEIKEENEIAVKNLMDNTTQANGQIEDCIKPEIKEDFDDREIMQIVEEEKNGEESRFEEKAPIETAHQIGQSKAFFAQSVKRKQPHKKSQVPNEIDNRDNEQDIEEEDDDEEVTSRSNKRPRPTTSSSAQEKQIITVTLQCPQSACGKMIDKDKFTKHLMKHSIGPFQCPVKKCGESFDNRYILRNHIPQSHQDIIEWHCNYCDHHLSSYRDLSQHNSKLHQLGLFQCSFPSCTFTGEYRGKVYDHYAHQHKNTEKNLNCEHVGCHYKTGNASKLKRHNRSHLGIKPYRCKWSGCDFAATEKSDTVRHIRQRHLKSNSSTVQLGEPGEYVEVVNELL